jgi:hypothetical protein
LLGWDSGRGRHFLTFLVESFFFAAFLVEVQLDAVIEVGFLEHLAQIPGAQVGRQRLLFKVVHIAGFGFAVAMRMTGSDKLLFLDGLFLNEAFAGSVSRNRHGFFRLLFAAESKETKFSRRQRVNVVRCGGIVFRLTTPRTKTCPWGPLLIGVPGLRFKIRGTQFRRGFRGLFELILFFERLFFG